MGKKTQAKQIEKEKIEQKLQNTLKMGSITIEKQKSNTPIPLSVEIEGYESFIEKSPETFNLKTHSKHRDKQLKEFVRHVFNRYSVPNFLYQSWTDKEKGLINFKNWYICVAQGGSLYKEHAKEHLTKKEVHIFLNQKHELKLSQALMYSVARATGASDGTCLRIAKSKISDKVFNEYWKNCVRFFAKDCPPNINEINDISDFLAHKYNENNNFSIFGEGFTALSLKKKTIDWHHELRRLKVMGNLSWEGHPFEDSCIETVNPVEGDIQWIFKQIKTGQELAREGNAMHHCVYSYKDRCIKGYSSIWSVTRVSEIYNSKKALTIEVNNNGAIVQVRGFANRVAKKEEVNAVNIWSRQNGLNHYNNY